MKKTVSSHLQQPILIFPTQRKSWYDMGQRLPSEPKFPALMHWKAFSHAPYRELQQNNACLWTKSPMVVSHSCSVKYCNIWCCASVPSYDSMRVFVFLISPTDNPSESWVTVYISWYRVSPLQFITRTTKDFTLIILKAITSLSLSFRRLWNDLHCLIKPRFISTSWKSTLIPNTKLTFISSVHGTVQSDRTYLGPDHQILNQLVFNYAMCLHKAEESIKLQFYLLLS